MKLYLAYFGDPVLRKKTAPVKEITPEIRQLVTDMIETMHAYNGIGLAAPQVHQSLAIFVTYAPVIGPEGEHLPGEVKVFINPKLSNPSKETIVYPEGCLSIPGIYLHVERPVSITVTYMNLQGETITEELTEWPARVAMHENDHINGVLFMDRLHGNERKKLDGPLQQLKKRLATLKSEPKHPVLPENTPEL